MVVQGNTVCGSGTSGPSAISNEYREVLILKVYRSYQDSHVQNEQGHNSLRSVPQQCKHW